MAGPSGGAGSCRNLAESGGVKKIRAGTAGSGRCCDTTLRQGGTAPIPAVVVGGTGPGTLGLLRSLSRGGMTVFLLDENAFQPAMHSRYGHKVVSSAGSGPALVKDLLALADTIGSPAVLFLNSDDAALTVSKYRAELENSYRLRLPSHDCLTSMIHKTNFQRLAEIHDFPLPRSVTVEHVAELSRLPELRFPCIVKPTRSSKEIYAKQLFARGYKVASPREAEDVCRRILPILPSLVIQEWIEGPDSDLYFCLQYRGADGNTVCSFTGRKLGIWPPDVGLTASCTAAPEAQPILQPLTEAIFRRLSFVGMGSIEYKKDARTGQFLIIEPTVGRINGQEEVATLHGANIPLAAYLYEAGLPVPHAEEDFPPVIWRDPFRHWRSVRRNPSGPATPVNIRVYDAYWRLDDPVPMVFHLLQEAFGAVQRGVRRIPALHRLARSLKNTVYRARQTTP
jgi:D-aspartate ligase